jgi:LacI family transcriptional regulator
MVRRIRIADVAAEAGVSISTVSVILNEVGGARVSPDTRDRVRAAAARLGYVPNSLARGLRLQRSGTIGFIGDTVATTPYAVEMILGAQESARDAGRLVVLTDTQGDPDLEAREITALLERQVDGILYATMYHRQVEVPALLRGTPVVLVDAESSDPAVSSVVPDEYDGGRTAVGELLTHGHRRIGFVQNEDEISATRDRLRGYRAALESAGIEFDPTLVVAAPTTAQGGYRAATRLLDRSDRPTGLFCFKDIMAMGVYQAAAEAGLRIPADLSVVGYDDMRVIASNMFPGLTSVALPHYEMGAWAVKQLLAMEDAEPGTAARARLPGRLVRRASVGHPRP